MIDTCGKCAIVLALPKDIKFAEELGYRIKLLGITKYTDYGIELRVHPALVPTRRLLANVEGAMNAVVVKGDAAESSLYYGRPLSESSPFVATPSAPGAQISPPSTLLCGIIFQ